MCLKCPRRIRAWSTPVPLTAMGRFNHEAACVDPRTGIVYLTEDRDDSLLYRFIPNAKGELAKGGRLEALAIDGVADSRNWKAAVDDTRYGNARQRWVPLDNPEAPDDDLRKRGALAGATLFARGEGMWWDKGSLPGSGQFFFTCTSGGSAKAWADFSLCPGCQRGHSGESDAPGRIELFYESADLAFLILATICA